MRPQVPTNDEQNLSATSLKRVQRMFGSTSRLFWFLVSARQLVRSTDRKEVWNSNLVSQ